jgi:hypothetical protein
MGLLGPLFAVPFLRRISPWADRNHKTLDGYRVRDSRGDVHRSFAPINTLSRGCPVTGLIRR